MKRAVLLLGFVAGWLVVLTMVSIPTPAVQAIDPTLDAALYAIAQATARAVEAQQARRATAESISIESTRNASQAQATQTAISVESTRVSLDDLRRQKDMTATAQWSAVLATATAEAQRAEGTRLAQRATTTSQAIAIEAQATRQAVDNAQREQLARTYSQRQDRLSFGLLVVEIAAIIGACFVLWRLAGTLSAWAVKMRPQTEPTLADVLPPASKAGPTVIEQPAESEPRMPNFVQVVDNPEMEQAISEWAEKFDAEHGGDNGNA